MSVASFVGLTTELIKLAQVVFDYTDKSDFINSGNDHVQGNICWVTYHLPPMEGLCRHLHLHIKYCV